jgi:hypothetical protein
MKSKRLEPSLEEWKALYEAAREFMEIRPWTWMLDSDLFGVQNPQNGELGYCCIMGELEEVFALAVYLGSDGVEGYMRMQSGEIDMFDPDLLHLQNCLMASFEDRDSLDKEDLQTIKRIGLKFRGRNAWPQFRRFLPGYVPWYLTKEEVQFLAIAIRQALDIACRFKRDSNLLTPPEEDQILVKVPVAGEGQVGWKDTWMVPPPPKKNHVPEAKIDEILLERIKSNSKRTQGKWEIDSFYFPAPVAEGDRPFFPQTLVIADHATGLILHTHLAHPERVLQEFQFGLLKFKEEKGILPGQVLVCKAETKKLVEPMAGRLGIKLKMVGKLKAAEEFKAEMNTQFLSTR